MKKKIILFVSLGFFAVAFFMFLQTKMFLANAVKAEGIVINVNTPQKHDGRKGNKAFLVVAFKDQDGRDITFKPPLSRDRMQTYIGSKIDVLYLPDSPQTAKVNKPMDLWVMTGVFLFGGIVLLANYLLTAAGFKSEKR